MIARAMPLLCYLSRPRTMVCATHKPTDRYYYVLNAVQHVH